MDEAQRETLIRRVKRRLKVLGAMLSSIALVLIAIYFLAPQWLLRAAERYQAQRAHLAEKSVQADGTRWSYYEGGEGPTLLLLHGYMDSKQTWLPMARWLTPDFRVIIPDLPGWGESQRNPQADYGYAAQAQRLGEFAATLHLGDLAIAGHSMGGAIAGIYAAQHPHDVAALILIDSAGVPVKDNAFARDLQAGRDPFAMDDRADFERLGKLSFENPPWLPPRFEDVFVNRSRRDRGFDQHVLHELIAPDQRNALATALPKVSAPTLAIWCRQDKIIDISALDAIRAGLTSAPRISVTEFNGCGHMSIMERPREIADAITRFVLMP